MRYDHRELIADVFQREFFETFVQICHENHAVARVQCHGAPVDLLQRLVRAPRMVDEVSTLPIVPLIAADDLPLFWSRRIASAATTQAARAMHGTLYFPAHPACRQAR